MKSGTETKLKFKQLQRRLDLPLWQARGLLDTLWTFVANNCPAGDIGRFTNEEIAIGIDWRGDHEQLINTLVELKWLDRDDNKLIVHDWHEHCEDTVHKRLARHTQLFADGSLPSLSRFRKEEQSQLKEDYRLKYGDEAVQKGRVACVSKRPRASAKRSKAAPSLPSLAIPSLTKPSQDSAAVAADRNEFGSLCDWLIWWNSLKADGCVSHGVCEHEPSQGVRTGWKRVERSRELQKILANRDAIEREIRKCDFSSQDWFRLEKLFGGLNRDGEQIVRKLLDGGYRYTRRDGKSSSYQIPLLPEDEAMTA